MSHRRLAFLILLLLAPGVDAQYVVVEARGGGYKIGQKVADDAEIALKEGERLVLIGNDGRTVQLRGPYGSGIPGKVAGSGDPKQVLAALMANRAARTSTMGVIRAGTTTVKTPDPQAIDITRSGPRCLMEGELPELWRPEPLPAKSFVIFPADRSWRADFVWEAGQSRMKMPDISKFEGITTMVIDSDQQEFVISFSRIPREIEDPVILSAWMLEKGCIQQADALLSQMANPKSAGAPSKE